MNREYLCSKDTNPVAIKCICPECAPEPVIVKPCTHPWDAIKATLLDFAEKHPHLAIGKIEVWDMGGTTSWKRKQTRKDWQAKLKEQSS